MPRKKGRPKEYEEGYEKATRISGVRLKKEEKYISERFTLMAEEKNQSIPDFLKKTVFPDFLSRHFKDMELRDFEKIFRELEKVPWKPDLQKALSEINRSEINLMDDEWKGTNYLEKYSLHPSIPLKLLFEADHRFFSNFEDFNKKILFQTWGEFLFEQGIITYGLQIPDINDQFIDRFETLANLSLTFLTSYQDQLIFISRGFKETFEEENEEYMSSRKKKIENGNLDPEKMQELENELEEADKDDQFILERFRPDKTHNIVFPGKDPIFPIIRIQRNTEIASNWGINEFKTLENSYSSSSYTSMFFSIFNLWRNYAESIVHLNFLFARAKNISERNPQFYTGMRKFLNNSRFKEDFYYRMAISFSRLNQKKEMELFIKLFETMGKAEAAGLNANLNKVMMEYIDPETLLFVGNAINLFAQEEDKEEEDKEEENKEEKEKK